jgi:hypothetical protein
MTCGADGHKAVVCTEVIKCKRCRESPHCSRKCDKCRPKSGCVICRNEGHLQAGCPFRPAFRRNGPDILASLLEAIPKAKEMYEMILAAGRIDGDSLARLDRMIAKRLEFMCNVPISRLSEIDFPPIARTLIFATEATPTIRAPPRTKAQMKAYPTHPNEIVPMAVVSPTDIKRDIPLTRESLPCTD